MSQNLSWRPKTSVRTRLVFVQALLTTFLVVFLAIFLYFPTRQSIETASNNAYTVLVNNLGATVYNSYITEERDGLIAAAKRVEGVKGVAYVLVQDSKMIVLYDTFNQLTKKVLNDATTKKINEVKNIIINPNIRNNQDYIEYSAPFLIDNNPAIIVRVGVSAEIVQQEFKNLLEIYLRISVIVLLIGIVVSYFISSRLTAPIRRLTENALAIRAGNLDVSANITTNDEMEQLAREFKRMVEQLNFFYFKQVKEKEKAIEDRKKTELVNQQLRDLDAKKNEFLSIASHQLRTPLSVILWSVSMIEEDLNKSISDRDKKLLNETGKSARVMESLINDLLDLSRIQHGKRKLYLKDIDLVAFSQQLVSSFQTLAEKKEIQLNFEKGSLAIPNIQADEGALRNIISNLIDNAIRYTAEKGKVMLRLDLEAETVLITVKDTGIGITPEEQIRIFTQFTRGERAMKISPDGSGLGLYLVKQLADELGGQVSVQSEVGKGSAFIVKLPLKQPDTTSTSGDQVIKLKT